MGGRGRRRALTSGTKKRIASSPWEPKERERRKSATAVFWLGLRKNDVVFLLVKKVFYYYVFVREKGARSSRLHMSSIMNIFNFTNEII